MPTLGRGCGKGEPVDASRRGSGPFPLPFRASWSASLLPLRRTGAAFGFGREWAVGGLSTRTGCALRPIPHFPPSSSCICSLLPQGLSGGSPDTCLQGHRRVIWGTPFPFSVTGRHSQLS